MPDAASLVLCSKSRWDPPVRREHALASMAADGGSPVVFLEAPMDVRHVRRGRAREWLAGLGVESSRGRPERLGSAKPGARAGSVLVKPRSTVVPGHRSGLAGALDSRLLRRSITASTSSLDDASVVCCWPWDWPAVAAAPARRRIFDMADDWGELMPGRRERFAKLYERIAAEADEVIVVNPRLGERFPGREPLLVRNGVSQMMLDAPPGTPAERTMVYVGTLTPRFDAPLVRRVLEALPEWRLEIIGGAMYPGLGARPAPELQRLLDLGSRVVWHGSLPRERLIELLDRASVAIAPNRPEHSLGQDSMKLFDYAARGRPIVSTPWSDSLLADGPPCLLLAGSAEEFAHAIVAASGEPSRLAVARRSWAAANTWRTRWPRWSAAVFGEPDATEEARAA